MVVQLLNLVSSVPLHEGIPDDWIQSNEEGGTFFVKSAYLLLQGEVVGGTSGQNLQQIVVLKGSFKCDLVGLEDTFKQSTIKGESVSKGDTTRIISSVMFLLFTV